MKSVNKRKFMSLMVAASAAPFVRPAVAQTQYPARPVRFLVPQPAGGGADVLVRTIQQKMQELLGQPVFIDNKPGAAGNIGTIEGARSAPDGYTIVFVNMSTMTINPHVYTKPGFSLKDFMPVTNMASVTNLICVHPAVPAKTLKGFLDLARAKPGVLNYGTAGIGSENHLMGELLKSMAKVDIQHVPFRGGGPAVIAAVGGQVEAIVADPLSALTQVKAGTLRALAVTSAERVSSLPDVPTVAEGGVPGYAATGWRAAVLPVGTPPDVAAKIHAAITGALKDPQIAARLKEQLYEPVGDTPEDFAKFIKVEDEKWSKLIAQIKLRIE